MSRETYEIHSNAVASIETEFTRTWEAKHGHRWVRRGCKYYPASVKEQALAKERDRGLLLPAPIGVAR